MGTQVSSEAAMATRLLLERLRRLSPSRTSDTSTVEEILSEVPVHNRERVLAVLEVLSERDPSSRGDDALATGARLVLDGARELWGRHASPPLEIEKLRWS
jgi:hypothetical protein